MSSPKAALSQTGSPRPTDELRDGDAETWQAAARHRFVRQLTAGEIDEDVYRAYLVQDHAFVKDLVSLFGYALARAPSLEDKRPFVEFLDLITSEENDYFQRAFEALEVPDPAREDPALGEATRAFQALMDEAAAGTYAETLAVLVPVEWIYLDWATWADAQGRPDSWVLDEWIELHANEGFEAFVEHLRSQLDDQLEQASLEERARVRSLFQRAVDLEVAFFDQVYALAGDEG